MSEHVHDYKPVSAPLFSRTGQGVFQMITGYRCACGKHKPRAYEFDPLSNVRAALNYYRRRKRAS